MSDATDRILLDRTTELISQSLAAKRLVCKGEELHRKREGTWDATTMVSETSPEGAALRAHRASLEKVTVAEEIAVERRKNETPPHEPTAPPTPLATPVENGTTNGELLPPAETATSEAEAPKAELLAPATTEAPGPATEATALETMGSERGHSSRCGRKNQKPPPGISRSDRKLSPESMRLVLESLTKCPIIRNAARETGLHHKTIERWIKCSRAGHEGYDVEWQGFTWRFHEAYEVAADEADVRLEEKLFELAFEFVFKKDPFLVDLGYQGEDAYATDKHGNFIRDGIRILDKRLALLWLSWKRPERYGKPPKHRKGVVSQNGDVLVIGQTTKRPQYNTASSIKARKWKALSRMVRTTRA